MAQVQFKKLDFSKVAPLPQVKRPEQIESWYKAARKAIPQIPVLIPEVCVTFENDGWFLFSSSASLDWIIFELKNAKDERAVVVIDRKKSIVER